MILKAPQDPDKNLRQIGYGESARECWLAVLDSFETPPKVLLPNYIGITDREGSGIFDPVTTLQLAYGFYLLEDDLSIDLKKLEAAIVGQDYDVVLLVHYFGLKVNNITAAVRLCKEHDLIVVEDCAHLYNYDLFELSDAGTLGDFTFYSLHKNFPVAEGGMLVQNTAYLNPPVIRKEARRDLATMLSEYNAEDIAHKRIANYKKYEKLVVSIAGIRPLRGLKQGDIPHNYPIVIENGLRERLYFWLIDQGVRLIALYYRLIDPLLEDPRHNNMQQLANDILNLPLHQGIEEKDINELLLLIKKGINELNA